MITYNKFIQNILDTRGRFGILEGEYKEKHHIIPRCVGGTNDEENLIDLYAREHFIAHKLLAEENKDNRSLQYAFYLMSIGNKNQTNRKLMTADDYEGCKKALAISSSGKNNPNYGGGNISDIGKIKIVEETRKHTLNTSWYNDGNKEYRLFSTDERINNLNRGRLPHSKDADIKRSIKLKGKKRPKRSKEWCNNISNGKKGKQTKLKGKPKTKEHKKHLSESRIKLNLKGERSPAYGTHLSEETKKLISKRIKERGTSAGGNNSHAKKVLCVETGEVFNCIKDAYTKLNLSRNKFSSALNAGEKINNLTYVLLQADSI